MLPESKKFFTKITSTVGCNKGDQLVWEAWDRDGSNDSMYWATVTKVTPKSVTVETPDASSDQRTQTWRMHSFYSGGPEYFEPMGKASGALYHCNDNNGMPFPEAIEIVKAAYQSRADAKAAKIAEKQAAAQERQERIDKEHAESFAANPNVEWTQFTTQGNDTYYHGHTVNYRGEVTLVIAAVRRMKNDSWDENELKAKPMIYKAAVNYAREASQYGPNTMGSLSECKADTLEDLFKEIIYRMWS